MTDCTKSIERTGVRISFKYLGRKARTKSQNGDIVFSNISFLTPICVALAEPVLIPQRSTAFENHTQFQEYPYTACTTGNLLLVIYWILLNKRYFDPMLNNFDYVFALAVWFIQKNLH